MMIMMMMMMMSVCSKQRRSSSGTYEKDDRLTEKEKELMEKDAEVSSPLCLMYLTLHVGRHCLLVNQVVSVG